MNILEFAGRRFELIRASDVIRDGLALQASELSADGGVTIVLEAFWHDPDGRLTFSAFEDDLPFALVELFVSKVRSSLTPTTPDEG